MMFLVEKRKRTPLFELLDDKEENYMENCKMHDVRC